MKHFVKVIIPFNYSNDFSYLKNQIKNKKILLRHIDEIEDYQIEKEIIRIKKDDRIPPAKKEEIISKLTMRKTNKNGISGAREISLWNSFDNTHINSYMLDHIKCFLDNENSLDFNDYLQRWRLNPEILNPLLNFYPKSHSIPNKSLNISSNETYKLKVNGNTSIDFLINNIDLYLFQSGIGFYIFDVSLHGDYSVKEIETFNYYIKYIREFSNSFYLKNITVSDDEVSLFSSIKEVYFKQYSFLGDHSSIKNLHKFEIEENKLIFQYGLNINDIINELSSLIDEDFKVKLISNHANLFTFINITGKSENIYESLYYLRKGYNRKYIPTKESMNNSTEILKPFENLYFGISLEGVSIINDLNKTQNEIFFKNDFPERVRTGYFISFIIALHKRFALLNFRKKLDEIFPSDIPEIKIQKKIKGLVENLNKKILGFYINSYFRQISTNSLYESFYQKCLKLFHVKDLLEEIKNKSTELQNAISYYISDQSNKRLTAITLIGFILAPLTLISGLFGMNLGDENLEKPFGLNFFSWSWFALLSGSVLLLTIAILFYVNILNRK